MSNSGDARSVVGEAHDLIHFIQIANESCDEAIKALAEPLRFLGRIDILYIDFFNAADGIKPPASSLLLLNAHASFRAAVRLALSGQLLPVYMVLRGNIESALYAHSMVANPKLEDIWLNRNKDDEAHRTCRQEFSAKKVFQCLEKSLGKTLAEEFRQIYHGTIDFGAHPNSRSLISSIEINEVDDGRQAVGFAYIHGVHSFELRQSVLACAEIGLATFFVALICVEERPDFVELNERALGLQERLPYVIDDLGFSVRSEMHSHK